MSKETHDRKVRQIAKELKQKRWKVQADLKTYDTPDGIGKNDYTPDIVATRGNKKIIIEVDTPDTVDNDQLASFRRSAAQRENTHFEHVVTKPKK
jgi:hypothetical protein